MDANSAEPFNDLAVARVFDEGGCRRVGTAAGINVRAAINAVVVEDDDANRQVVPTDRFDFHAAETKGAVAFHCEHRLASFHRSRDSKSHADAQEAPGTDLQQPSPPQQVHYATR